MKKFNESEHPRDDNGKFTDGNKGSDNNKMVEAIRKYSDDPGKDLEYSNLPSAKRLIDNSEEKFGKSKMTPEQKIASVHIEAGKNNVLPELNERNLREMGIGKNKMVLVKPNIFEKNAKHHTDIPMDAINSFVGEALYSKNNHVLPGKYPDKPYFIFYIKTKLMGKNGKPLYRTAAVDVTDNKDYFEVVHWHWADEGDMKHIAPSFK